MLQTIEKPIQSIAGHASQNLESQIGNTPLLQLERTAAAYGLARNVRLYAKAEWFNPGGSVKDRAALNIILTAEENGLLRSGMTLLDSTSGNTGIAYAMLGASRGYQIKLTMPGNVSRERMAILRAYGAELILTDPLEGSDGALLAARRIAAGNPDLFYANQYNNASNWQAHYLTTANEIWQQTDGHITHFVAGLGTGGTFIGTTRRLKELNPAVRCIACQPDNPFNGLEGWKHMETSIKPGIFDESLADENLTAHTEDAYAMARFLARTEGLFVGISSAAAVVSAIHLAQTLEEGEIVTIMPDSGLKYVSERFWADE